jgi:hypothetical protein
MLTKEPALKYYIKDKNDQLVLKDLNRRKAIKELCLNCSAWASRDRKTCPVTECQLHPYRNGELPEGKTTKDRADAIREYCLTWCCMGQSGEVTKCNITTCPCFPFRQTRLDRSVEITEK